MKDEGYFTNSASTTNIAIVDTVDADINYYYDDFWQVISIHMLYAFSNVFNTKFMHARDFFSLFFQGDDWWVDDDNYWSNDDGGDDWGWFDDDWWWKAKKEVGHHMHMSLYINKNNNENK